MGIYTRKGKYFIDYRFQGRRIRECVGASRRTAEQALAVRQAEIIQGRYHFQTKKRVNFREFAEEYLRYAQVNKRSWDAIKRC